MTPYGESKVLAEQAIHELARWRLLADLPAERDRLRRLAAAARGHRDQQPDRLGGRTGQVRLQSDGRRGGRWSTSSDIANAFIAVLESARDAIHDEAFNIGRDDANLRIRTVAELVEAAVPGSEVTFAEGAGSDARDYRVDFSKLHARVPAAAPTWTVEAGSASSPTPIAGSG